MRRRRTAGLAASLLALALLAACAPSPETTAREPAPAGPTSSATPPVSPPASPPATSPTSSPAPHPASGTTPPPWLGTRVLPTTAAGFGEVRPTPKALRDRRFTLPDRLPELPGHGFADRITSPPPAAVVARSTWLPGCPVGVDGLAWIRLTFWGFDDRRHTGELLANASVADDLVTVFRTLYRDRFPIEQMVIETRADLHAPPTGDGNATGSFSCRPTVGATTYSQHAYGLAVDVNTFQNPYVKGEGPDEVVLPELASAYLDRDRVRPGMIEPDGPVVRAFADIGWGWGGDWQSLKDYQHFSQNGR